MSFNVSAFSNDFLKPILCGVTAGAIEMRYSSGGMKSAAVFGSAVALGIASMAWVEPLIKDAYQSPSPYVAMSGGFMARIVEIGAGAGSAYYISRYASHAFGVYDDENYQRKLLIIAGVDVFGETFFKTIRPQN